MVGASSACLTLEGVADVYELFCNGTRLLEQGDFHAAAVPLTRARELEPDKDSIREALGRALFGAQRYEEAAAEFGAIVEHRPTDDYAQFCLGRSLQQLGRHAEARGEFERAAALTRNAREQTLLLSRAAACEGKPERKRK